jgi:hypothetical protein
MNHEPHERAPESLAKEIWFYSLERRAQTTTLRRAAVALVVVALILLMAATIQVSAAAAAIGAVATAVTLGVGNYLRSGRQQKSILAQLEQGANPQLVDATGSALANRSIVLLAAAIGVVAAVIALLAIGLLS